MLYDKVLYDKVCFLGFKKVVSDSGERLAILKSDTKTNTHSRQSAVVAPSFSMHVSSDLLLFGCFSAHLSFLTMRFAR